LSGRLLAAHELFFGVLKERCAPVLLMVIRAATSITPTAFFIYVHCPGLLIC